MSLLIILGIAIAVLIRLIVQPNGGARSSVPRLGAINERLQRPRAQSFDGRVLAGRIQHQVVRSAIPLLDRTRLVRSVVLVGLHPDEYDSLGRDGRRILGQQICEAVDQDVVRRGWEMAGSTSIRWSEDPSARLGHPVVTIPRGDRTHRLSGADDLAPGEPGSSSGRSVGAHLVDRSGRQYPIADGLELGRGPQNDVVIDDDQASRRHATIALGLGTTLLTDRSTNGTYVNGEPVVRVAALQPGDVITIASTDFEYRS